MSGTGLVFPASEHCLWDRHAVGEAVQACVDGNCWVRVRVSLSVLQLAVRASRQTSSTPLHCLLLGTAFVSKKGSVAVDVDRFDVGRHVESSLIPTALVPGDVVIYCTVGPEKTGPLSDSLAQAHLLRVLKGSVISLQPTSLLYFHVHLATDAPYHSNTSVCLSCQCVYPAACTLTPVPDLHIVPTALARNLAGPRVLPVLQDTIKWGYLTIEVTRKLVLLLNTDPKSACIPLVGVWVSGVESCSHPAVWASVLHYKHCGKIGKRMGRAGLCLIYSSCSSHSSLFEFQIEDTLNQFTSSTFHTEIQLCADSPPLSLELIPCHSTEDSSSKCITNCGSSSSSAREFVNSHRSDTPLPSPQPVLARDSQLSCVSFVEGNILIHSNIPSSAHRPQLPQPIINCQGNVRTPTTETGTNTGVSLLLQQVPGEINVLEEASSLAGEASGSISIPSDVTIAASIPSDVTIAASIPSDVTVRTETSIPPFGSINLDLPSFATSTLHCKNTSERSEECESNSAEPCLFHCDKQQFYQKMIDQVQEMLQNSPEHICATPPVSACTNKELSIVPVPQILNTVPSYVESTLDETGRAADLISMKYVGQAQQAHSEPSIQSDDVIPSHISIATDSYLRRHRLSHKCTAQVLDVERIRTLPKLI